MTVKGVVSKRCVTANTVAPLTADIAKQMGQM
jgi:hypothetical protein